MNNSFTILRLPLIAVWAALLLYGKTITAQEAQELVCAPIDKAISESFALRIKGVGQSDLAPVLPKVEGHFLSRITKGKENAIINIKFAVNAPDDKLLMVVSLTSKIDASVENVFPAVFQGGASNKVEEGTQLENAALNVMTRMSKERQMKDEESINKYGTGYKYFGVKFTSDRSFSINEGNEEITLMLKNDCILDDDQIAHSVEPIKQRRQDSGITIKYGYAISGINLFVLSNGDSVMTKDGAIILRSGLPKNSIREVFDLLKYRK